MAKKFVIQFISAVIYWLMVIYVTDGIETLASDRFFICFLFIMSQIITYFVFENIEE